MLLIIWLNECVNLNWEKNYSTEMADVTDFAFRYDIKDTSYHRKGKIRRDLTKSLCY